MVARVVAVLVGSAWVLQSAGAWAQEACFERLDNGTDMTGWKKSATNHHGPGDGWTVEDGAFVGRQTAGNKGGILMTEKSYKDVEVVFDVKIDWGCDSGFFFRTTAGDRGYQVNVDHLQDAGVGTIWGEGFSQELRYRPYFLSDMGNVATKDPALEPIFDLAKWPMIWHPTEFNQIRARVEGNPPHMQVWISDLKVVDFTDTQTRAEIDATGPLAIQVHGGAERWKPDGVVQFKNIRVRDLSVPCNDPDPSGGAAGTGGVGGSSVAGAGGAAGASSAGGGAGGGASGGGSGGVSGAAPTGGAVSGGAPTSSAGMFMNPDFSDGKGDGGPCACSVPGGPRSSQSALVLVLAALVRRARRKMSSI